MSARWIGIGCAVLLFSGCWDIQLDFFGFATPGCAKTGAPAWETVRAAEDGECCLRSQQCRSTQSICNLPTESTFTPTAAIGTCLHTACVDDVDCAPGESCGVERVCRPSLCGAEAPCAGGQSCVDGRCLAPGSPARIASCALFIAHPIVTQSSTVALRPIALDAAGDLLPDIAFSIESADLSLVRVRSSSATGGGRTGATEVIAHPSARPDLACRAPIMSYGPLRPGTVRAIVVDSATLRPIPGALVHLDDGPPLEADAAGVVEAAESAPPAQVLAAAPGFDTVLLLEPAGLDLLLPLPARSSRTREVRGRIGGAYLAAMTSSTSLRMGVVGRNLEADLFDLSRTELFGPLVTSESPAHGRTVVDFGGAGTDFFGDRSADDSAVPGGVRCGGVPLPTGAIGCYLLGDARATWGLAGGSVVYEVANPPSLYGRLWMPVLEPRFPYGLVRSLAADPLRLRFGARYLVPPDARADLALDGHLDRHTILRAPLLSGPKCPPQLLAMGAAELPGRGLLPIGFNLANLVKSGSNCVYGGGLDPFGRFSDALPAGQLPLSTARLLEPHASVVLLSASTDGDSTLEVTHQVVVQRTAALGARLSFAAPNFLPIASATVRRSLGVLSFGQQRRGTVVRLSFERETERVLVYAPVRSREIRFANSSLPLLQNAARVEFSVGLLDAPYAALWAMDSAQSWDRASDTLQAFTEQVCAPGLPCALQ
ncbi:MAG: hypothetical protein U1E65_17840 [Myxococcota bacterium]